MATRVEKDVKSLSDFIKGLPMFFTFSQSEVKALVQIMELWRYKPGELVFGENDPGDSCYLIVSGMVGVSKSIPRAGKNELNLTRLTSGTIFGQVSLIDRGSRSASCLVIEHSDLLRLQRNAFDALFHTGHPTAYRFQDVIARMMVQQLRMADHALAKTVHTLLSQSSPGKPQFKEAVSHATTAASATVSWRPQLSPTAAPTANPESARHDFITLSTEDSSEEGK